MTDLLLHDIRQAARAERQRAVAIIEACTLANRMDLCAAYIASNLSPDDVRLALTPAAATEGKSSRRIDTFDARAIAAELAANPRPTIQ